MLLLQKLVSEISLLAEPCQEKVLLQPKLIRKNVLLAQTCQEKCVTQLKPCQAKHATRSKIYQIYQSKSVK